MPLQNTMRLAGHSLQPQGHTLFLREPNKVEHPFVLCAAPLGDMHPAASTVLETVEGESFNLSFTVLCVLRAQIILNSTRWTSVICSFRRNFIISKEVNIQLNDSFFSLLSFQIISNEESMDHTYLLQFPWSILESPCMLTCETRLSIYHTMLSKLTIEFCILR